MARKSLVAPHGDPARDNWYRYQYMRDAGHSEFVDKSRKCEDFVAGQQWDDGDLNVLRQSGRPALTINKLLSTVDHLKGEQLFNRAAIAFRPARGMANTGVADALTKVHMNIAQANRLSWVRTDVFEDGIVTGRGFFDARIDINSNFMGDVKICRVPPELVLLDPDASDYDPEKWSDVGKSMWMSLHEIALLYGKDKAKELEPIEPGYTPYEFADDDFVRDGTFGNGAGRNHRHLTQNYYPYGTQKFVRVFERQYYDLVNADVFVDTVHGEIVPVPEPWDDNRISEFLSKNPSVRVLRKYIRKIRWSVSAGPLTLHDSWSPYRYMTIVPFFPHFRQGRTHGIVEHLIGPQEAFNKTRSQELHVINTSANSGWIVQENNLVNMTEQQLETRGSQSGVVIVAKDIAGIDKIKPNQVPTGLDRASYKNEEDMKNIAGISDAQTGFAREDVSGRALRANQAAGSTSFAPLFDNLARTDHMLGHRILSLIQTFYTEPRLMHIVATEPGQENEVLVVNEVTESGEILNDLSLGEYEVVVTSEPDRDSFEDSQFDQAMMMRKELGIEIPDEFMIRVSKLRDKEEIIQIMNPVDPEQEQFDKQMAQEERIAELEYKQAQSASQRADALLKSVRAASEQINMEKDGSGLSAEAEAEAKVEMLKQNQKHQNEKELKQIEFFNSLRLLREEHQLAIRAQRLAPPSPTPARKEA